MITFHIITIFPEMIRSYANESILGRAQKNKKIAVKIYNPRDFTRDKHKKVDDIPYGGGPGMVMKAEPVVKAIEKAISRKDRKKVKIIFLSPNGKQFTNQVAAKIPGKYTDIVLIAGRYEGVDARVKKILRAEEWSVGPYILSGGELPALILLDAIARQTPGVLGKHESLEEKRIAGREVYTRPEIFEFKGKKYRVPKVLLSGHHERIKEFRKQK